MDVLNPLREHIYRCSRCHWECREKEIIKCVNCNAVFCNVCAKRYDFDKIFYIELVKMTNTCNYCTSDYSKRIYPKADIIAYVCSKSKYINVYDIIEHMRNDKYEYNSDNYYKWYNLM